MNDHDSRKAVLIQYVLQVMRLAEALFIRLLLIACISLLGAQCFILSSEENQSMANKTARYEGVFQEDPIESKATMRRN